MPLVSLDSLAPRDRSNTVALAEDLEYLEHEWESFPDDRVLRRTCVILRRLLLEGALSKAAKQLGFERAPQLMYRVIPPSIIADLGDDLTFATPARFRAPGFLHQGMMLVRGLTDPAESSGSEPVPSRDFTRETVTSVERFLESPIIVVEGLVVSYRQVIKYIAYKRAGVHVDSGRTDEDDDVYALLDSLSLETDSIRPYVAGRPLLSMALLSIGQTVIESRDVRVLRDYITGRIPADEAALQYGKSAELDADLVVARERPESYESLRQYDLAGQTKLLSAVLEALLAGHGQAGTVPLEEVLPPETFRLAEELVSVADSWKRRGASLAQKLFHLLFSMIAPTLDRGARNQVRERAAHAGVLFAFEYKIDLDSHFAFKRFACGVSHAELAATIRFADGKHSRISPERASPADCLAVFYKRFIEENGELFVVCVICIRDRWSLKVVDAFRIYRDLISGDGGVGGHELIGVICRAFGVEWSVSSDTWTPTLRDASLLITGPLIDRPEDWPLPCIRISPQVASAHGSAHFTVLHAVNPEQGGVRHHIALAYGLDYALYRDYLRSHGVDPVFEPFAEHSKEQSTILSLGSALAVKGHLTEHHDTYLRGDLGE